MIGQALKRIFFRNPGNAKTLAAVRDVKPQNLNFTKGEGGINGEGTLVRINTEIKCQVLLTLRSVRTVYYEYNKATHMNQYPGQGIPKWDYPKIYGN